MRFRSIAEVSGESASAKAAVVEAILFDDKIKQAIRLGGVDSVNIYRLAKDQDQYESLASAGVRLVESGGCKLKDCMQRLESNTDAAAHPGRRIELATKLGQTLTRVGENIDLAYRSDAAVGRHGVAQAQPAM